MPARPAVQDPSSTRDPASVPVSVALSLGSRVGRSKSPPRPGGSSGMSLLWSPRQAAGAQGRWAGAAANAPQLGGGAQPQAPTRPMGATPSLSSKWLQMGGEWHPCLLWVGLRPSRARPACLPSPQAGCLPGCLSLAPRFSLAPSLYLHSLVAGAHGAGDRPPEPCIVTWCVPAPGTTPAASQLSTNLLLFVKPVYKLLGLIASLGFYFPFCETCVYITIKIK